MRALVRFGLFGLALSACVVPMKTVTNDDVKAAWAQQPDRATVVLVSGDADAVLVVDENKNCLASPFYKYYFIAKMTPGTHDIITLGNLDDGKAIRITVEGGKTYVLKGKKDPAKRNLPDFTPEKLADDTDRRAVDREIGLLELNQMDPAKCPEFIKKFWYTEGSFDRIFGTLKTTVANAPPVMVAKDGIPIKNAQFATPEAPPRY